MKKIVLIFFVLNSIHLFAQNFPIKSISISLPANPDANTANWGKVSSIMSITASAKSEGVKIDPLAEECKILVTIKMGGVKLCGIYSNRSSPPR